MTELGASPWWAVMGGAVPAAAGSVWVAVQWAVEQRRRRQEGRETREDRLTREIDAQRAALSKDQVELLDRMRSEVMRYQERCAALERDRDRGWYLARWWNQRAHELRHAGLNAQTMVLGLLARDEALPRPVWPDMTVPGIEEPP